MLNDNLLWQIPLSLLKAAFKLQSQEQLQCELCQKCVHCDASDFYTSTR